MILYFIYVLMISKFIFPVVNPDLSTEQSTQTLHLDYK